MPFKIVYQKSYLEYQTFFLFFVVFKPHHFKSNQNVIQPSRKDKVDEPLRCLDVPQVLLPALRFLVVPARLQEFSVLNRQLITIS